MRRNRPAGGSFLTLSLPFTFDDAAFQTCAGKYGVLMCRMPSLSLRPGREHRVRVSYCYVTPEQIDAGVRQLGHFVRDQVRRIPPGRAGDDHERSPSN